MRTMTTYYNDVHLTLDEGEQFITTAPDYFRYRGRSHVLVKVTTIIVDLVTNTVRAQGAVVLGNGTTAGYGHPAVIGPEKAAEFFDRAREHARRAMIEAAATFDQTPKSYYA